MNKQMNILGLAAFALLGISCGSELSEQTLELTSETLPEWEIDPT